MKIVIFDGDCAFCNHSVVFILKRDKKKQLVVCPSQSEQGKELITKYAITTRPEDSLLFIENNRVHVYSSAALHIAKYLNGLYPLLFYVGIVVPPFIRNGIYKWIAKRRKKIIKGNTCSFELAKEYSDRQYEG
jgi:predicted DCC family thiol-disulfide oxidoreductase YuxK